MAKFEDEIFVAAKGKVGDLILSSWKGIPYLKSRPTAFHDAKTKRQLNHRMKFALLQKFLKSVKEYIKIGYCNSGKGQSYYTAATSYLWKNALVGEYPNVRIDPAKVMVSLGKLEAPKTCAVTLEGDNAVFTWDKNEVENHVEGIRHALPLVYNFAKMQACFFNSPFEISEGRAVIALPAEWRGDEVNCYIGFSTFKNDKASNSQYLGTVSFL